MLPSCGSVPSLKLKMAAEVDEILKIFNFNMDSFWDSPAEMSEEEDNYGTIDPDELIRAQENKNTKKKTKNDMKIFQEFLKRRKEINVGDGIETLPKSTLNELIANFLVNVRKKSGEEYEPSTLRGIFCSINRYLVAANYYPEDSELTIVTDPEFKKTRKALAAKQKELKGKGKGSRPRKARALTKEEVDLLFEEKVFTLENPEGLLWLNFWNICKHFGIRPGEESRNIRWKDVTLHKTADGKEYIMVNERLTKTRNGMDCRNVRENPPLMFSTSGDLNDARDPVSAYKMYALKRPANLPEDSPFYIRICQAYAKSGRWYFETPMGHNTLDTIIKKATDRVGIHSEKHAIISNHSVRKTTVKTLKKAGVADTDIQQVTGHANVQSINSYNEFDIEDHENISHALSHYKSPENDLQVALQPNDKSGNNIALKLPSISSVNPMAMFSGATINNCTFNMNFEIRNSQE